MVVANLAPTMLTALPTMDLSPWEPTPFVHLEFALTRTSVKLTTEITLIVPPTLDVPTVKPTELARLAPPTLTVEFWTEDSSLDNLNAKMMELVVLAPSMPTALPLSLTVGLTEAATIVPLLVNLVVDLMVVKILTNLTAIPLPTSV
jgi:hypothetical protein